MESRSDHGDPAAMAGAAHPRWVLLELSDSCHDPADPKTVAHARTSDGRPFSVSLVLAAPPALSRMCLPLAIRSHGVAAHGDSVLVKVGTWEYFLYCAGDAAADPSRPPSLSQLPPCYLTEQTKRRPKERRYLDKNGMALLRRGQGEVLVAALDFDVERVEDVLKAELCLLRSGGDWEWELRRLPVIHDKGKRSEVSAWVMDKVITVGDRIVLWVDYFRGIILIHSDLSQETAELRYVSLPVDPDPWRSENRGGSTNRSVCAATDGTVRFVEVSPRCCCGCPGEIACAVSCYAFTITTWALRMEDMTTWDKVSVIDCDQIWSLPGYHDVVPRLRPTYPMVSPDEPDVLYFIVDKSKYDKGDVGGELGTRVIEIDTRRMELRSVCNDKPFYFLRRLVASEVYQYFDANAHSRTLARRIDNNLEKPAMPLKLTFTRVAPPEEMLATLREVPGLARDDMLKAYGVLVWDESQLKFRSLLTLPLYMRKEYCLSIAKLSCFDV